MMMQKQRRGSRIPPPRRSKSASFAILLFFVACLKLELPHNELTKSSMSVVEAALEDSLRTEGSEICIGPDGSQSTCAVDGDGDGDGDDDENEKKKESAEQLSSVANDGTNKYHVDIPPPNRETHRRLQSACRLFLAESTIPNSGLGIFTSIPMPRGVPVAPGDVVIQLPDLDLAHADGLRLLVHDYVWDGQETGGQYEGKRVYSVIPGVGMLANGHMDKQIYNVLPFRPDVDEADLPRTTSPGAGAISHYHNFSFYTQKPMEPGDEILINYGPAWFSERQNKGKVNNLSGQKPELKRSVQWLRENGICLDNIRAGRSTNPNAGRGAFASRFIPKGEIIAPLPVVQITKRESLKTYRLKASEVRGQPDTVVEGSQLLLNYCYGHKNSSLLLYPYSPVVNFINHDSEKTNAALRWSNSTQHRGRDWTSQSLEEIKNSVTGGLMLELVATRDVFPKEEIFLNYGSDWEKAWNDHVAQWTPPPDAQAYSPSYVMDDVVTVLRTEEEQRIHPYPDNVFTSCFYRYRDNKDLSPPPTTAGGTSKTKGETTASKWQLHRGIFELTNLRPCSVLKREKTPDGRSWYTALMRNRYGMAQDERIPKGEMHIVTHIPREAIRFTDKLYTTDQHLPNVFRREIGIPDEIFPRQWMDLL